MSTEYRRLNPSDTSVESAEIFDRPPIHLTWQSLTVEAKGGSNAGEPKKILQEVTGGTRPGEFLAIMGPSGAGKTTFLNCVSKRDLGDGVEHTGGTVFLNG